jgi:hypothetical protein
MEKLMNKMEDMEMDKVAGGRCNPGGSKKRPRPSFHDSNANSMAANVDETQMKLPIGGGHKITFETQNASACVGK